MRDDAARVSPHDLFKAVAINADRETAHRYWGDALMMGQGKRDASREHFVDAIVAEPYTRNAWVGLVQ